MANLSEVKVSIRMPESLLAKIQSEADKKLIKPSALIRAILQEHVEAKERSDTAKASAE